MAQKILTIVGARPQLIKLAPLSCLMADSLYVVHTGQHFDAAMSDIFFNELGIALPDINLGIRESSHAKQVGRMMMAIEDVIQSQHPKSVLVFDDTNSTLAGALAAAKLTIPLAHVEAGLRSFDKKMPEEINRVCVDHMSDQLFCPTQIAVDNLSAENITNGVHLTGDCMLDATLLFSQKAQGLGVFDRLCEMYPVLAHPYYVMTLHRASNTDNPDVLRAIFRAISDSGYSVVFCVHPRTRHLMDQWQIQVPDRVHLMEPVGYLDMVSLVSHSVAVMTDSGGLQKEAFFLKKRCITLRDTTEWVETVQAGVNELVLSAPGVLDRERFLTALETAKIPFDVSGVPYGEGKASERMRALLLAS